LQFIFGNLKKRNLKGIGRKKMRSWRRWWKGKNIKKIFKKAEIKEYNVLII
jgi:hypothetical protein